MTTFISKILRNNSRQAFTLVALLLLGCVFSSCFTGIEGTKKINLSREDKKLSNPTSEERLMAAVTTTPLKDWQQGRDFLVADDKALFVIVPQQGIVSIAPEKIKGETLHFQGVESKMNVAGKIVLSILFSDGVYLYAYDTGKEFDDAMETVMSDQVPMLIDLDMVVQARKLLTGKKVYTRSPLWYDREGNRINGRKFVEVTITDVMPGDMVFPLWVKFTSAETPEAYMYMNLGNADNESRAFHNLFSLTDVRRHYPNIDDETWEYISPGKVKEGMTKDEVRLSMGNPTDLRSGHDYSQTLDIWGYENGTVLWFEDGRIVRIRQ